MKTKLFYSLLTFIVIGIVIPTFAISPDKNKGEKTKCEQVKFDKKTDNLAPTQPPPPTWSFNVVVLDPNGTCSAQGCTLYFEAFPANEDCEVESSVPVYSVLYTPGTPTYLMIIPDDNNCVVVRIVDHTQPHGCQYSINPNWCCECKGDGDCRLYICPN